MSDVLSILVVIGIPSGITGLCFSLLLLYIKKRDAKREEREEAREKCEVLLIQSVGASTALGEATAEAVRDHECNGKMTKALEYTQAAKHALKDFLTEQGVKSIFGDD